jgi:hypothetical protein
MAQVFPIFQPVTAGHQHVNQLVVLAAEPWMTSLMLSSAFANSAGVAAVAAALAPVANRCRAFIGVRNGSTTAQSLSALLRMGVEVYGVDTAMRGRIFHPKLYLASGDDRARAIIGSANLTHAGLHNNMEAGADLGLDLNDPGDKAFVDHFTGEFARLVADFPEHCFPVTSGRQILDLINQGLLEDERNPKTETALGAGKQGAKTSKARIALPYVAPPKNKHARKPRPPQVVAGTTMSVVPHYGQLVWAKPDLPSGDLQLLDVGHTSGVLRLTQARYEVNGHRIDQTTYFRNQVFSQLVWTVDQAAAKEIAEAPVSLIVAGVYVGDFDLQLSHKPAWEAGQHNYTTGLHWHDATEHVRKPGLIGRTLRLYEPAMQSGRYVIEID